MTKDDNAGWLPYAEDDFDLDKFKRAAQEHAEEISRNEYTRRVISFFKMVIFVVAFVVMFCLYHLINEYLVQYDYNRYSGNIEVTADFIRS